jgi:hypothetical protein
MKRSALIASYAALALGLAACGSSTDKYREDFANFPTESQTSTPTPSTSSPNSSPIPTYTGNGPSLLYGTVVNTTVYNDLTGVLTTYVDSHLKALNDFYARSTGGCRVGWPERNHYLCDVSIPFQEGDWVSHWDIRINHQYQIVEIWTALPRITTATPQGW